MKGQTVGNYSTGVNDSAYWLLWPGVGRFAVVQSHQTVCVVSMASGGWLADAVIFKHTLSWPLWPGVNHSSFLVRGKLMTQWFISYSFVHLFLPECTSNSLFSRCYCCWTSNCLLHSKPPSVPQISVISSDFSWKSPTYSIMHNQNMRLMHALLHVRLDT